jgi:heme-degrading monooxygenase HmoA
MFLAMNRFKIALGKEQEFIAIWKNRDTFLQEVPGFKSFNLMSGPIADDYALFVSHSLWESRQAFEDWTRSEAFRKAHANAGTSKGVYLGPPQLELFEAVV